MYFVAVTCGGCPSGLCINWRKSFQNHINDTLQSLRSKSCVIIEQYILFYFLFLIFYTKDFRTSSIDTELNCELDFSVFHVLRHPNSYCDLELALNWNFPQFPTGISDGYFSFKGNCNFQASFKL